MNLRQEIVNFLRKLGMDDVGFADVAKYKKIPGGSTPKNIFPEAKIAIVYLYKLKKLREKYGHWYIVSLNNHLSKTNKKLIRFLEKKEFKGVGVSENLYDRQTLIGKVSFRELAVLAGLGAVGENQMVIHPKLGARAVIGVVFTDTPLKPDKPFTQDLCTHCAACEIACLTGAINKKFDRFKCKKRRKILGRSCGIACIKACPIGNPKVLGEGTGF